VRKKGWLYAGEKPPEPLLFRVFFRKFEGSEFAVNGPLEPF
jgi:hypothetical protein